MQKEKSNFVCLVGIMKLIWANNSGESIESDKSLKRIERLAEYLRSAKYNRFKGWGIVV